MFTLLVGGARSGKSTGAERLASRSGADVVFLATATAGDPEMADRIAAHRRARPAGWSTIEEPVRVLDHIAGVDPEAFVVLDCLTLWVSNLLEEGTADRGVVKLATEVADALADRPGNGAVVSNDVGGGIVPDNALARRYRDLLGSVNTVFADRSERALLMVAGRAVALGALEDV
jgi:adenosylcobinamide kinase / adenosylcobinamide-phosphate guanylyltransferase